MSSSAFHHLHPELRRAIAEGAGWRELRPIQELSIPALLSGDDCLILAPTAGGKTEAALIPILQMLLSQRRAGLQVLYLCPLKALLNNQLPRLEQWARWVGMGVFLWHGDIGPAARQAFVRQPCEILMTTPESLEVLLTAKGPAGRGDLWSGLRLVLVDEIHAFAGEERGDHLLCMLERLARQRPFQRIGLSATIGNPATLLSWMQGSNARAGRVVDPGRKKGKKLLEVHPWAEEHHRHLQVARLTATGKSLVFVDSRRKAEELSQALESGGQQCFLHHASLSVDTRLNSEQAFQQSAQACIVCTSTMELGLDVGDLDRVVQVHSPSTVASLLQRLGRSGRRLQPAHMAFVTDEHWSFLQTCALLQLAIQGYVEPLEPSQRSLAIYAQQALARVVAEGGVPEGRLLEPSQAYPFRQLSADEKGQVLEHLCQTDLLQRADGRLVLGRQSERKLGGSAYRELYSVFSSSQQYQVVTSGGRSVGQLDAWFAWSLLRQSQASFALGGSHWVVLDIDKATSSVIVEAAAAGALPQWHGPPRLLSPKLCQAMRGLLTGEEIPPFLDSKGQRLLQSLRDLWQPVLQQAPVNLQVRSQGFRLFTFAGGRINQTLALLWEQIHELRPTFNNFYLHFAEDYGDLESVMRRLQDPQPIDLGKLLPPLQLGKFQQFLPPHLEQRYRAERLLDIEGSRQLVNQAWSIVELAEARA
ncbi:DEAD/DEAH box helicase [bacterium]|nr:DEAD/DEAH box helicase [bacterium]